MVFRCLHLTPEHLALTSLKGKWQPEVLCMPLVICSALSRQEQRSRVTTAQNREPAQRRSRYELILLYRVIIQRNIYESGRKTTRCGQLKKRYRSLGLLVHD
jgi:hypothetical protein